MYPHTFIRVFLICLTTALNAGAEVVVKARFDPPRIMLGDRTRYVLKLEATGTTRKSTIENITRLSIPSVDGLQFNSGARRSANSQRMSISNGKIQHTVSREIIVDVTASATGRFTVPEYTFQYKEGTLRIPATTLEVVERTEEAAPPFDELIFLKMDVPERLYVGQSTQVELKMYVSSQAQLLGLANLERNTDGFTVSEITKHQESRERYNGDDYRVLTWPFTITPIHSGEQTLHFQSTVTAQLPGPKDRRTPFGSTFFNDFFRSTEQLILHTKPLKIQVLPLPASDQPPSFNGAIGNFALKVYPDREETVQGEPIMLSIEMVGEGNFERINSPSIPKNEQWRIYEPESTFTPHSENNGLRGSKRFDYLMVPEKAGFPDLPVFTVAYFDPEAERYIELSAPPIQIKVNPLNHLPTQSPSATAQNSPEKEAIRPSSQPESDFEEILFRLEYQKNDATSGNGQPIIFQTWFLFANTFAGVIWILGYGIIWRKRLRTEDPVRAAHYAAKQELATAKKAAMRAKDIDEFYRQAPTALRLAMNHRNRQDFRSADSTELDPSGIDPLTRKAIMDFFDSAEAYRFSKHKSKHHDLAACKTRFKSLLKAL